ncbi:Cysteine protease atg4 [Tulasnella sp. 425]|nr:Cysteine protease atg4 [Tulasnella sp. 425]
MSPSSTSGAPSSQKINKIFHRNPRSTSDHPPSSFGPIPESSQPGHTNHTRRLLKKSSKTHIAASDNSPPIPAQDTSEEPRKSNDDVASLSETPIIVEPPALFSPPTTNESQMSQPIPRSGRRSVTIDRPLSIAYSSYDPSTATSSPTTARALTDISSRLSGWFSQNFAGSSTDLPSTSLAPSSSQATVIPQTSPKHKASGIFNVARHPAKGLGGGFEKAVRYFLDSDAQPDKCTDPIWLMGVQHPGYEPPSPTPAYGVYPEHLGRGGGHRRDSTDVGHGTTRRSTPPTISRGSTGYHRNPSLQSLSLSLSGGGSASGGKAKEAPLSWPPAFYDDFTSCVWMTYRSQYFPIRDISLAELEATKEVDPTIISQSVQSPPRKWWGGEKSWTSDSGWGCMVRTGQSLLATALVHLHLGRDYATYVKIITWFLDSPSTLCPFGVHRMVLAGKELGTDVGCWFGPSIAAGAIKRLTGSFLEAGLSVSVSSNNEVFATDIYAASNQNVEPADTLKTSRRSKWGGRPVLLLICVRLGIDGVNPVYHDGLKVKSSASYWTSMTDAAERTQEIFTWPQSVGISGGRPSSSYYFVGQQAGSLFYLDPHHTRPAVPLRPPPPVFTPASPATTANSHLEPDSADDKASIQQRRGSSGRPSTPDRELEKSIGDVSVTGLSKGGRFRSGSIKLKHRRNTNGSPTNSRTGSASSSASFSLHAPLSPSPLSQSQGSQHGHGQQPSTGAPGTSPSGSSFSSIAGPPAGVDPTTYHLATAYSPAELRTFHCDKVRKMPLSHMDPSMLLGFLCKDEAEWNDLRARAQEFAKVHKPIFTIQDEPPSWSDPDDLESFSDPDPDPEDELEADRGSDELFEADDPVNPPDDGPDAWRGKTQHFDRRASSITNTSESFTTSDDFEDDEDFGQPVASLPQSEHEAKRTSVMTDSTKASSGKITTNTDDSFDLNDDEDWDSSVPSSSSPPAVLTSKMSTGASTEATSTTPQPGEHATPPQSPPRSSTSSSASPPPPSQYPFPRVPSPAETPAPGVNKPLRMPNVTLKGNSGIRSLKAKDGGRTPSGGVLAIFNPQQEGSRDLFASLTSAQIIFHGHRSAGYGSATFNTENASDKVITSLDKRELNDRAVIVGRGKPLEAKADRAERRKKRKATAESVSPAAATDGAAQADVAEPKKKEGSNKRKAEKTSNAEEASSEAPADGTATPADANTDATAPIERTRRYRKAVGAPRRLCGEAPTDEPSTSVLFVANLLAFSVDGAQLTKLALSKVPVKTKKSARDGGGNRQRLKVAVNAPHKGDGTKEGEDTALVADHVELAVAVA